MGLARRGARRITVDGVAYRWVVSPDDGTMILVVERANGPGKRLEAVFAYDDIHEPDGPGVWRIVGQRLSIRPGVVRAVILSALARGWQPSIVGAVAFRIRDGESLAQVIADDA